MGTTRRSIPARVDLGKLAALMRAMPEEELLQMVSLRLQRVPDEALPPLTCGEDPSDLFGDCADRDPKLRARLRHVSTELLQRWGDADGRYLRANAESLGELLYLCARIEAVEAVPAVARVAGRASLAAVPLWGGEDLQNRALRCLAGLLLETTAEARAEYRPLFEEALHQPHHVAIGLTALCTFWPDGREDYIRTARELGDEVVDEIIGELDSLANEYRGASIGV